MKMATKSKPAITPSKKILPKQSDISHLSEDIISNVGVGIYIVQQCKYVYVSPLYKKLTGYSDKDLINQNSLEYIHPDDRDATRKNAIKVLKGESSEHYEYRFIKKTTEVMWILEMISSVTFNGERAALCSFMDITERKRAEEALRHSEKEYKKLVENASDVVFRTDVMGRFTFGNPAMLRISGYTEEEFIGRHYKMLIRPDMFKKSVSLLVDQFENRIQNTYHEFPILTKDGCELWIGQNTQLLMESDNITGFQAVARDITENKRMEEALRQSEERYRTVMEEMEEWYFETDLAGNITFLNDSITRALGYSQKELTGLNFRTFFEKKEAYATYKTFHQVYETGKPIKNFPLELAQPDGSMIFAEMSILTKRDKEDRISGFRGVGHDITARKHAEEQIQFLASHDSLTGLPNRMMFSQMLNHAIQSAKRYKRQFAVCFIDLDRFKIVNDTLGHEAGDQLLQEMARRFKQTLRAADVVARLGGDEFVILIEEANDLSQIITVAQKILAAAFKPMSLMNEECRVTASIGISIYPQDATDEQSLMKTADKAMYFAKEEGKNNFQFYSKDIKSQSIERMSLETHLRLALENNELSLHYQAKLDIKTDTITGVEALLRWHNPQLGEVSPTQLIPVAEETGLIVPIGRWVMKTACKQNVAWQRQGLPPVCMAVNLSRRQFMDNNLVEDIKAALQDSGMAPNLLELEITESMVMYNPTRMVAILTEIKNMGVRLALDDFGTGYSSLAQIKDFPIDTLKVDRSFIRHIPKDSKDIAIIEAIIAMGRTLSLTVVAEGVETREQLNFLQEHSCDEMQGYYFSKAIAPDQFADLLNKHLPQSRKI